MDLRLPLPEATAELPCWEITRKGHRTELEAMNGDLGMVNPGTIAPFSILFNGKIWENDIKWSLKLIIWWRVIDDSPLKWRYMMIMIDNWWIYVTMLRNTKLHHPVGGLHLCRADTSAPMLIPLGMEKPRNQPHLEMISWLCTDYWVYLKFTTLMLLWDLVRHCKILWCTNDIHQFLVERKGVTTCPRACSR